MITLSHDSARRLLHIPPNSLSAEQRLRLEEHLSACLACGEYASSVRLLQRRLAAAMHARWDSVSVPALSSQILVRRRKQAQHQRQAWIFATALASLAAGALLIRFAPALLAAIFTLLNIGVLPPAPAPTLTPTPIVTPAAPTQTLDVAFIDCGSREQPRCSIEDAQRLAGFEIYAPDPLPPAVSFSGAFVGAGDNTLLLYRCGANCQLILSQASCGNAWPCPPQAETIEGVSLYIGSHPARYASGEGWQTLQWSAATSRHRTIYSLRIDMVGMPDPESGLDRAGVTALAENTVDLPSPTGLIAFESDRDGNSEIYAFAYRDSEPTNLTNHPAADHSFAWSPDGERIAFLSDRSGALEVYTMAADGADLVQLTAISGVRWNGAPAWSPDGTHLAVPAAADQEGASLLYTVDAGGAGHRRVPGPQVITAASLQWSPDGDCIVLIETLPVGSAGNLGDYDLSRITKVNVEDGRRTVISGGQNKRVADFGWSPDGNRLAYLWQEKPGGAVRLEMANANGTDAQTVLVDGTDSALASFEFPLPLDLSWSPDGSLIAYTIGVDPDSLILSLFDAAGMQLITSTGTEAGQVGRISWSPQGQQILMAAEMPDFGGSSFSYNIIAWLPEADASPEGRTLIGEIAILETSDAGMSAVANPHWQPRPP